MARLESIAVGGYFPTPPHLATLIGSRLHLEEFSTYNVLDPCAGDGEAVAAAFPKQVNTYSCELEATRYTILSQRGHRSLQGDAFRVVFSEAAFSILYLNPPYDTDPVKGRLEERWLERFIPALAEGGILIFIVPFYALKASAETLARHFEDVECYRFPDADYEAFSQVVLYAKKADRLGTDEAIRERVLQWAQGGSLPLLGEWGDTWVPAHSYYVGRWEIAELDTLGLISKYQVWTQTGKSGSSPVPGFEDVLGRTADLLRTYPVAVPPRPAHIAAGIATGLFNGKRISSETPGLPDLLVKGVFDREYQTVEAKTNKKGEVTSVVQVQQPKLVVTILDLSTQKYHTLRSSSGTATQIEDFGVEDLLKHYGSSLMQSMLEQCPIQYDPRVDAGDVSLVPTARPLYTAQGHAAKAIVRLLGGNDVSPKRRLRKSAILLGEIGSGKTSVVLAVAATVGRKPLVMCPPHLLTSWENEVKAVLPDAKFHLLDSPEAVDRFAEASSEFQIGVMSRETAKLGHGWESVTGACPSCGAPVPAGDLAKKRARCGHMVRTALDPVARLALDLSWKLALHHPEDPDVQALLSSPLGQRYLQGRTPRGTWGGFDPRWQQSALTALLPHIDDEFARKASALLLIDVYSSSQIIETAKLWLGHSGCYVSDAGRYLGYLLEMGSSGQQEILSHSRYGYGPHYHYGVDALKRGETFRTPFGELQWKGGVPVIDGRETPSQRALRVMRYLARVGKWSLSEPCGEALYQAIPKPRRYPLANYIVERHPNCFDLFIADEAHELSNMDSAQGNASQILTGLGKPTVYMTGSVMNGYAKSLFATLWGLSGDFKQEFDRDRLGEFVARYGYRKRVLTDKDLDTGTIVGFGTNSDRVERSARVVGDAPGVLPLLLFRHLLSISVTLHKSDLALDLPPCREIASPIQATGDLRSSYETLKTALAAAVKKDRFDPERAGKLLGMLAELPSYLDRATLGVGNREDGTFEIRYPESLDSELVCQGSMQPPDELLPKEQWLIATVRRELEEGRNAMVFCWHLNLIPRIQTVLEQSLGEKVAVMYAAKVPTSKRQAWIDKQVVQKKRRVLVTNPVAIQTGLNNLVHFSTEVWMENPAVNPTIYRQAVGRVDRIGQRQETRIYLPYYEDTLQATMQDLLLRKTSVAVAADGLDPEASLRAAGVLQDDDGYLMSLSLGRQLWNILVEDG